MEFYVEDSGKALWHRVAIKDIIMCQEEGRVVIIHRLNKPKITCAESIDAFQMRYLKGQKRFVRANSAEMVNKDMIICMIERPKAYVLKLEGGIESSLKRGHDYAYEIRTGKTKPNDDELYKEDQEFIDKTILAYSDCNYISDLIFDKTGLRLTARYIRARYKVIKNY